MPEACELFSSRAGGLGPLNPHQCCFHCSGVSVFFSSMPFSCLLCACFFMAFLILHTGFGTSFIGIRCIGSRVSFQSLEGKSRYQNEGVANVSHRLLKPKFLRPPAWVQRWGKLKDVTDSLGPCSSLICS